MQFINEEEVMGKPNILFILSDDHGQWALGAYGNQDVKTPNIDSLASKGVRFDNFFCTSPVCSPARASIATGKIPSQHGVHDWLNGGNLKVEEFKETTVQRERYKSWLNQEQLEKFNCSNQAKSPQVKVYDFSMHANGVQRENEHINYLEGLPTYSEILAKNGYNCGLSGKWHLGSTSVKQAGFDFWRPIAKGGTSYMRPEVIENGKVEIKDKYVSEYIADNAIEFLNQQTSDTPFYLSVHFTAPHSPWGEADHPQHIWNQYDEEQLTDVKADQINEYASPTAPYPNQERSSKKLLHGYYSAITAMDEQIGRVLKALDDRQLNEDTIIIYTSDNGMNLGQHGVWGKGNGTYPLNFYEESIKVPFIFKPSNKLDVSRVESTMLSQYDILPTLVELVNADIHLDDSFPGRSFKSLLDGEKLNSQPLVIFDEYGPNRMIRSERFKLIRRYSDGDDELYDLEQDPTEQSNLLLEKMANETYYELSKQLDLWFEQYTSPIFDGRTTNVTGFGQYDSLETSLQPFEKRPK